MQGYETQTAETHDKVWNDRMEQFMKRNKSKLVIESQTRTFLFIHSDEV